MQRAFTVAAALVLFAYGTTFAQSPTTRSTALMGLTNPTMQATAPGGLTNPMPSVGAVGGGLRRPDIHDHQIDLSLLGDLHALSAILCRGSFKLLVQRKLIRQRIAQLRIIVDNENLMGIRHQFIPP